jgi:hypothetical protein
MKWAAVSCRVGLWRLGIYRAPPRVSFVSFLFGGELFPGFHGWLFAALVLRGLGRRACCFQEGGQFAGCSLWSSPRSMHERSGMMSSFRCPSSRSALAASVYSCSGLSGCCSGGRVGERALGAWARW